MRKNKFIIIITILCLLLTGCTGFIDDITTNIADSILESTKNTEIESISSPETNFPEEPAKTLPKIQVHFIDVGQGDSILIQTSSSSVLIDGGEKNSGITSYLEKLDIGELDIVIGTHAHADHIGGLIDVLNAYKVYEVIDPGAIHTTKTFEEYLRTIDKLNIKFTEGRTGLTRDLGDGVKLEIIHPTFVDTEKINNTSIVAKLTHGEVSFLFTGDAEKEAEQEVLSGDHNLKSTILKVGHHGSNTSTTSSFLKAINPEVAIIMVGENSYGHPHEEILNRLVNVSTYRTDLHGNITITSDGKMYEIKTQKNIEDKTRDTTEGTEDIVGKDSFIRKEKDQASQKDVQHKININTATMEELIILPGIGKVLAENIIKYREHGEFTSIEELMCVEGIGEARFKKIRDLITVE